ncbi:hypothetical protein chiPu_0029944, partial [Chiloscyllium punctatum]|nr:hypothetical protein [Chiloscyllium punctatum]
RRDQAIDCYERGMRLDFNAYYCSSNLPRLYRARAEKGDEDLAQDTVRFAIAACERARSLKLADEWLRPTLLAAAFDLGQPPVCQRRGKARAAVRRHRQDQGATLARSAGICLSRATSIARRLRRTAPTRNRSPASAPAPDGRGCNRRCRRRRRRPASGGSRRDRGCRDRAPWRRRAAPDRSHRSDVISRPSPSSRPSCARHCRKPPTRSARWPAI